VFPSSWAEFPVARNAVNHFAGWLAPAAIEELVV
jgi:hypothetical protein